MNNYEITMDSFGQELPANWEDIADYLNDKINAIVESYGDDAETDPECADAVAQVWENYWNGKYDDAPEAVAAAE